MRLSCPSIGTNYGSVDVTHWFRVLLHEKSDSAQRKKSSPKSKAQIKTFVEFYNIQMSKFDPSDIDAYPVSSRDCSVIFV
jgi:hypothetical protein